MDCEGVTKALIYTWLGGSKSRELTRECVEELKEGLQDIRERIRDARLMTKEEYLMPKSLRDKNVTSEDLVRLALYELARRISLSAGGESVKSYEGMEYVLILMGYKAIVKGYCERCEGYKYHNFQNGFVVSIDGIVYAEFFGLVDENEILRKIWNIISAGGGT